MINGKLFNPRDILLIGLIVVAWHVLAAPLFNLIDATPAADSPDAE